MRPALSAIAMAESSPSPPKVTRVMGGTSAPNVSSLKPINRVCTFIDGMFRPMDAIRARTPKWAAGNWPGCFNRQEMAIDFPAEEL